MSDNSNFTIIKKRYCRPAIYIEESEFRQFTHGKLNNHFHIERFVFIDQLMSEYRVIIPEETSEWAPDEKNYRLRRGIQTRSITYLPTGKVIYDNTLHPARAVVFEYELEQFVKYKQELTKIK